jgi:hypothetical protein
MSGPERINPFPGPQPYRAEDRSRFFGRDEAIRRLSNHLIAHPCTMLFGPSGCGKSSLMQAGVIPWLEGQHGFRVVRVDGWPPGQAPLSWFSAALAEALGVTANSGEKAGDEGPEAAIRLAYRRSDRPILIYVDQLEQLFYANKNPADVEALFEGLSRLSRAPLRGLQMVLSLREDYLGRFRDRLRGRNELWEHGFRLGPLTAEEMARAVCSAAACGVPPRKWTLDDLLPLMIEVRTPGQLPGETAEVQAAFAQIVCMALWDGQASEGGTPRALGPARAETILHRHLDKTLDALGPLKADALRLLEEYLIDGDGHRTLLTEDEAHDALPDEREARILEELERGGILRAEEHQGRRYFELGHDWLASKVFERRKAREEKEADERKKSEEQRRLAAENERRAERRAASRRRLLRNGLIAILSVVTAFAWMMYRSKSSQDEADKKLRESNEELDRVTKDLKQKNEELDRAMRELDQAKARGASGKAGLPALP